MTKKLQELFELPQDEIDSLHIPIPENAHDITTDALSALEKIDNALPQVRGLDASDNANQQGNQLGDRHGLPESFRDPAETIHGDRSQ
jgi:hypothetical protein